MENPSGGSVPARVNPTPRCAGLKDEFKVVANAADFERKTKQTRRKFHLEMKVGEGFRLGRGFFSSCEESQMLASCRIMARYFPIRIWCS